MSSFETNEIRINDFEARYEATGVTSANTFSINFCLRNVASKKKLMLLLCIPFNVPLFVCSMSLDGEDEPQRPLTRQRSDCHLQYINSACMKRLRSDKYLA